MRSLEKKLTSQFRCRPRNAFSRRGLLLGGGCLGLLSFLFPRVVQGMITGIRGLCNGLGPALYGFIFFLFNVELKAIDPVQGDKTAPLLNPSEEKPVIPGPPFLFGACAVLLAFLVALFIPDQHSVAVKTCHAHKHSVSPGGGHSNTPLPGSDDDIEPLLQDSSV